MAEAAGGDFLLYGSYGYTGRLIVEQAVEAGLRPLLAGRDAELVERQASEHALPWRAFALEDEPELERALRTVPLVLHAAGPFSRTWRPMAEACLRTGTHYLDITGEIEVFEALAALDDRARAEGVMLLPGTGFDVVPTDCLAVHLAGQLPGATHLALAFQSAGGVSRGTARTVVENLGRGGVVRREGRLERVPLAWRTRRVDFGEGEVAVTTIPWGDVSTAYHSTGIPDIEVYTRMPGAARRAMLVGRHLGWLLGSSPVQRFLRSRVDARRPGPDAEQRTRTEARVWGEVRDATGNRRTARMRTPDGYTLTALAAVELVRRGLLGASPGFTTPGLAYGADWVLELPGVRREEG